MIHWQTASFGLGGVAMWLLRLAVVAFVSIWGWSLSTLPGLASSAWITTEVSPGPDLGWVVAGSTTDITMTVHPLTNLSIGASLGCRDGCTGVAATVLSDQCSGQVWAPGSTCTIRARLAFAESARGNVLANLWLNYNGPGMGYVDYTYISARVEGPGPQQVVYADPALVPMMTALLSGTGFTVSPVGSMDALAPPGTSCVMRAPTDVDEGQRFMLGLAYVSVIGSTSPATQCVPSAISLFGGGSV
jgi:hypothetical protein